MPKKPERSPSRRQFLTSGSTALAVGVLSFELLRGNAKTAPHRFTVDDPATHNMLLVGRQTIFLSHLPMFNDPDSPSPHRYQAILEAAFTSTGAKTVANPQTIYFNDRKKNPATKIYTLNPEEFILPSLISTTNSSASRSFQAKIFRGHLEKPDKKLILKDVTVTIRRVIHFREFAPAAASPGRLEYILFGKGNELFLAHLITRPPDFDQVLSVSMPAHRFTDEALGKGIQVIFERANSIADRFAEKQEAVAEVREAGATSKPLKVKFRAGAREIYFEEGELRVPADFAPTEAERKAKFP